MATIGLDLDSVAYPDLLSRLARFIERRLSLPDFTLNCEAVAWSLEDSWPEVPWSKYSVRNLLDEFTHDGLFLQGALSPGLGYFIRRWETEGHRVVFVTARTCTHSSHESVCKKLHGDTFSWMREVGIHEHEVYFTYDKHTVKCDLLVDDHGGNLIDHNAMIRLLWHQPHNRTQSHPQFIRVTEWREVDYYVSTLPKE